MRTKLSQFCLLLFFLTGPIILSGCKKEGCTDPDSITFDSEAKKDNGTCKYEGKAVIWYGQNTAIGLVNDGAVTLTFYVDNQIVGSTAASVYFTGKPNCGQNGSISITKDLGNVKSKAYSYSVKDQTGFEYWKGVLNFTANSCDALELTW